MVYPKITSLQCPNCSDTLTSSHPISKCGVDFTVLFEVDEYAVVDRDVVIDASILQLVKQETAKYSMELTLALLSNCITIYAWSNVYRQIYPIGKIVSFPLRKAYSLFSEKGVLNITTQTEKNGDTIYLVKWNHRFSRQVKAIGLQELINLPQIKQWVTSIVPTSYQVPEKKNFWNLI